MKRFEISHELDLLPEDAVTQAIAILARRSAGKTYTALVMAEEFALHRMPFVFLDPLGAAWGLRVAAKSKGFPVVIIGGSHADVPLEQTAGKVIADLVVDHPGFYIVDMSLTESNAAQDRFATDFAERLYRRKAERTFPLHLFVDEADSFIPQRPMPGQQRMLGAFEAIVRRGRIRGLGITMISQRAAVINKNALSQTECMIVLQMTAPHDRKAIEEWAEAKGTKEQLEELMGSLASLQRGKAWVWSPSWLNCFKLVQIRSRHTFDSSATPKAGDPVQRVELSAVDIERLGAEIKATVERAKENDPALLRKQVADLQIKIRKLESAKPEIVQPKIDVKKLQGEMTCISEALRHNAGQLEGCKIHLEEAECRIIRIENELKAVSAPLLKPTRIVEERPFKPGKAYTMDQLVDRSSNGSLSKCERAILSALSQYPHGRTQNQVAILTGYSTTSGGFNNNLSSLRTKGFITRSQPIQITDAGRSAVGDVDPLPTGQALADMWLAQLSKCESAILRTLLEAYPEGLFAAQIGERTGYRHTSGGFNNSLSRLRTLELIQRGTFIKASDNFFQ